MDKQPPKQECESLLLDEKRLSGKNIISIGCAMEIGKIHLTVAAFPDATRQGIAGMLN
ncbi:hypothetical protein [Desulfosarcina cetonica]|uniref:hypothetical protein n=1 Tax=Desulfosarcina cetonica TaxID=90730 RepID=UPI0012ECE77E|nr:hypothetical protein [Desulfosarcina cetonica]